MKTQTTPTIDILPYLQDLGFDSYEIFPVLLSISDQGGARQLRAKEYQIGFRGDEHFTITLNKHLKFKSIVCSKKIWAEVQPTINAAIKQNQTRIARAALFSYRQLDRYIEIPNWLQIRPVACQLNDKTALHALPINFPRSTPQPFVIEVAYRSSDLIFLNRHRSIRAVQEAKWLLAAFLDTPIFDLPAPYAWIVNDGSFDLAQCGMATGLDESSNESFSDTKDLPKLLPVSHEQYFKELGINSQGFQVPDIDGLYKSYERLSAESKLQFLRSCASIFASNNPTITDAQRVVGLVSAIEPLIGKPERCKACQALTGTTRLFREFLDNFVQTSEETKSLYEQLYGMRSKLVHGGWNFDVDEPLFSLRNNTFITPLIAWVSAKQGIINWLVSQ
jgi:hypothetical protein